MCKAKIPKPLTMEMKKEGGNSKENKRRNKKEKRYL